MAYNPFTEDHEMLRESVRATIAEHITPYVDEWERDHVCPKHIFKLFGEQGYTGATYAEELGGSGMDMWAAIVIARELARANVGGLQLSWYANTYLAPPLINALGTDEQKEQWLKPIISGDKICSLGITEPGAGSDVGGITTTAVLDGDEYVINGSKCWITNGTMADVIMLVTRTGEGHDFTLFLFDTTTPGFSAQAMTGKLGMHTSDTAELFFDNCRVPKSAVLGHPHNGFYYIMSNLQEERLIGAAMGAYAAEWAYEKALAYTQERMAFGRPIAGFQAVRHKLANMACRVEACLSMSLRAVEGFMAEGPAAIGLVSKAKAFVGEEAQRIVYDAMQLHGGNGFMEEYGLARTYRDLRLFSIGGGTTEIMYEIISKLEVDKVAHAKKGIEKRS